MGTAFCFSGGIWKRKLNIRHRTFINSVSRSSKTPFFTKVIGALDVAKICLSFSKRMFLLYEVLGAAKWTIWPSKGSNISLQGRIIGEYLKSFRNYVFVLHTKPSIWTCSRRKKWLKNELKRIENEYFATFCWPTYANVASLSTTYDNKFYGGTWKDCSPYFVVL